MEQIYFTRHEARNKTGDKVEALSDFPSVPKGSEGTVVKACPFLDDKWVVRVEWKLSGSSSLIDAMFGDISLNLFRRTRAITDDFCKSEYEMLLRT